MTFDEAIKLAKEIMLRDGWNVIEIHHNGYYKRWDVAVRQIRWNRSMYWIDSEIRWKQVRDRLEKARENRERIS